MSARKREAVEVSGAREAAVDAIAPQVRRYPDLQPLGPSGDGLSPRDRALALAIYRTTIQRWLTIEHVLRAHLTRSARRLDPSAHAVLLVGGAQLLFMEKLPAYAVVNEAVAQARRRVRPRVGRMVNAVLRRLAEAVVGRTSEGGWTPAADAAPWRDGMIRFDQPYLPHPDDVTAHLGAAFSCPRPLVESWREAFGDDQTLRLLRHGLTLPPTIVHAPDLGVDATGDAPITPHERDGFVLWQGDHAALQSFLAASPRRWVQDPTASEPVHATAGLAPGTIIDYCAGVGTKTRQLADTHPDARIICTDRDPARLAELQAQFADHARIVVRPPASLAEPDAAGGRCDLLLLDVPCSTSGVLARRPEARYRYRDRSLASLVELQRQIIAAALPLLAPGGTLVYSTCSIEPRENEHQAAHIAEAHGLTPTREQRTLPAGENTTHHDGGYFARLTTR